MKTINIATQFSNRLVNRDEHQGDGKFNALEFRSLYLSELENEDKWKNDDPEIELDFSGIEKLGPSFANEAFAFFAKFSTPEKILKKIRMVNISPVKLETIFIELRDGYWKK
jgi:hypothetical protein